MNLKEVNVKIRKLFLVEQNGCVVIRNIEGVDVHFSSNEEFYKYCPISEFDVDISDFDYINYEEDRHWYSTSDIEEMKTLPFPNERYEVLINSVEIIRSRWLDPYYGLSLEEAKAFKKSGIKGGAYNIIIAKWPLWKQGNVDNGRVSIPEEKIEMDRDIISVIDECNLQESEVEKCATIEQVKVIEPNWPKIS